MIWSRPAAVLLAVNCLLLCGCPNNTSSTSKPNSRLFSSQEAELVVPASLQLPALWEVALQEWRGDQVFRERFFYEPPNKA